MTHISEEQISAYIDGQLAGEESGKVERHIRDCATCRAVYGEMQEVTHLFRDSERIEPSPFLWNRIEAGLEAAPPSVFGWKETITAHLRAYGLNPGFAAAAFVVVLVAAFVFYHGSSLDFSERAALAEIDRTYRSLAAYDPEVYNPFRSGSPLELDVNPFRSLRLGGATDNPPPAAPQP